MTDSPEKKIELLENEIQEKNRIIATLQTSSFASVLFNSYFHEMNNKIYILSISMSSLFEVCRKKGADRYINQITEVIEDLKSILETMGYTFFGGRLENKVVSIEECIHAVTKIIDHPLRRSGIILKIELDMKSGKLKVPQKEFTNVLLFILMNAIDALQEIYDRQRLLLIRTTSHDKLFSITIKDNGDGIDDNTKAQIWEPGFTTKRGKSGFGMAWAKSIVVGLLGGQIKVESELGKFREINIILPEEQGLGYENNFMD